MYRLIIIFFSMLPLCLFAQSQEKPIIEEELQRKLDGRMKVDELTDEQLRAIAEAQVILEEQGISPEFLKAAKEDKQKEIDALYDNSPREMVKEIITLSSDPGELTPVIYATPGHEVLVNIIDSTGEPWPLIHVSGGNDSLFEVEKIAAHTFNNIFRLRALQRVGSSNLTLLLKDKPLSLTLRVDNDKNKYHPQPIVQVLERGPNASAKVVSTRQTNLRNHTIMTNLMFKDAPESFTELSANTAGVDVWKAPSGSLFVRTKLHPTSPRPTAVWHGPNGYGVYEIPDWPVLIMKNDNGVEIQVDVLGEL